MAKLARFILSITTVLCAPSAFAIPIISVDLDPASSGVQDTFSIVSGTSFTLDIVVSDVTAPPLHGFQFSLGFDSALLSATSVVGGSFLPPPIFTLFTSIGPSSVQFSQLVLGPLVATGSGVIASITFATMPVASDVNASLFFDESILSGLSGSPLDHSASNATLTLTATPSAAPEPSTLVLIGLGLSAFHFSRRRTTS